VQVWKSVMHKTFSFKMSSLLQLPHLRFSVWSIRTNSFSLFPFIIIIFFLHPEAQFTDKCAVAVVKQCLCQHQHEKYCYILLLRKY